MLLECGFRDVLREDDDASRSPDAAKTERGPRSYGRDPGRRPQARVYPTFLDDVACDRPRDLLSNVDGPEPPDDIARYLKANAEAKAFAESEKRRLEIESRTSGWPEHNHTAIWGCDYPNNHLEVEHMDACKTRCFELRRCRGFSYLARGGVCFLKTCADEGARYPLQDVVTVLRGAHAVAPDGSSAAKTCSSSSGASSLDLAPADDGDAPVAILVTIHDALEWVEKCLASIFKHTEADDYGLYVVDDGSAPETRRGVERAVDGRSNVYLVNWDGAAVLEGYTRAANAGVRAARGEDPKVRPPPRAYGALCLLNSDVEVLSATWLPALRAALASSIQVGAVGPLSNAASYQSVPVLRAKIGGSEGGPGGVAVAKTDWSTNPRPDGWRATDVALAVARSSRLLITDVPVLNGFCLCVKAAVFDVVGLFDDVAFPHGFGEENDFALRARRFGYELKVVDGVYLHHHKSKSYGDDARRSLSLAAKGEMKTRWGKRLAAAVGAAPSGARRDDARLGWFLQRWTAGVALVPPVETRARRN